jgi:hypothetical protein
VSGEKVPVQGQRSHCGDAVHLSCELSRSALKNQQSARREAVGPGVVVGEVTEVTVGLIEVGLRRRCNRLELDDHQGTAGEHNDIGPPTSLEWEFILENDSPVRNLVGQRLYTCMERDRHRLVLGEPRPSLRAGWIIVPEATVMGNQ